MIKIIEGENTFLSKQRLNSLIEEHKKKNVAFKILNADNHDISSIMNEYETQDMFSKEKVIVVKRLLLNKKCKDFVEIIFNAQESVKDTHLIIWEDKNIPKNTRYFKLFNEIKAIESFPKFNKRSFQKWALEQIDFEIEPKLIEKLMEMTNFNPELFLNEITKLKLLNKKIITQEDLKINTQDSYTNNIWEFLDTVNQKNKRKESTKILTNLLKNRVDPHYLMVMLARNTKQLLLTKRLLNEKKSDREISSILKIPPFTLPRLKNIAEKSEYDNLLSLYAKIYNLNYETKIGRIEPELGLLLLLTRLN